MNQPNDPRPLSVQLSDPEPGDRWTDLDPMSDPRREHLGFTKPKGKTDRLLRLLDSLESEQSNRRWHR
jgi:hypothetical protein